MSGEFIDSNVFVYLFDETDPGRRIMPSQGLYHRGLDIQGRYRYGFYDALIIAAALDAGCTRLYSKDLQHGQQIDALTIENSFQKWIGLELVGWVERSETHQRAGSGRCPALRWTPYRSRACTVEAK